MKTYQIKEQLNKEYIVFEITEDSKTMKGLFYTKGEADFFKHMLEVTDGKEEKKQELDF